MSPCKRAIICYSLPSVGVTLLHRYYTVIRLPTCHLVSLLCYHLSTILTVSSSRTDRVSPVAVSYLCVTCQGHRPRGSFNNLTEAIIKILLSVSVTTSAFPISGSYGAQSLQRALSACYLVCLRLKIVVTYYPPKLTTGGWLNLTRRDSHPLYDTTLLGRTTNLPINLVS